MEIISRNLSISEKAVVMRFTGVKLSFGNASQGENYVMMKMSRDGNLLSSAAL